MRLLNSNMEGGVAMKETFIYASDPELIRKYIREGHKVVSIGYFPNNPNSVYHFTFKKKQPDK